jgi:hypothetical protein
VRVLRILVVWFRTLGLLACIALAWLVWSWFPSTLTGDDALWVLAILVVLLVMALSLVWIGFQTVLALLPASKPTSRDSGAAYANRSAAIEDLRRAALYVMYVLPFTWLFSFAAAFEPRDVVDVSREALIGALVVASVLRVGQNLWRWFWRRRPG